MPWVPRDLDDAHRLERGTLRRNLSEAAVAVPVGAAALVAFLYFVPSQYTGRSWPLEAAITAGVVFLLWGGSRTLGGRARREPLDRRICAECFERTEDDPADRAVCDCGGRLDPLSSWKWVDPEPIEAAARAEELPVERDPEEKRRRRGWIRRRRKGR